MISVTSKIDTQRLLAFSDFADAKLEGVVRDGIKYGETFMMGVVPRGRTNRLSMGVTSRMTSVTDSTFRGVVGVDETIAPHASYVDKGTGIDGPFRMPVTINRMSRNGKRPGAMKFQKRGESGQGSPTRYRPVVKATRSTAIRDNKDFSGKTYRAMLGWTEQRSIVLTRELGLFFVSDK